MLSASRRFFSFRKPPLFDDPEGRRKFLDEFAAIHQIRDFEDWYNVKQRDIKAFGGTGLLCRYGRSLIRLLKDVYPQFDWKFWRFDRVPPGYWFIESFQRQFLDDFAQRYMIKNDEDWYAIHALDISKNGGGYLIQIFGSHRRALVSILKEKNLKLWKFDNFHIESIADQKDAKEFVEYIAKQLGVAKQEDWHRVKKWQLMKLDCFEILERIGGLSVLLSKAYPEIDWIKKRGLPAHQVAVVLHRSVCELLHWEISKVFLHYIHPEWRYSFGNRMIFDVFVPSASLALDSLVDAEPSSFRNEKKHICERHGVTYIEVSAAWDLSTAALGGYIGKIRPDLVPEPQTFDEQLIAAEQDSVPTKCAETSEAKRSLEVVTLKKITRNGLLCSLNSVDLLVPHGESLQIPSIGSSVTIGHQGVNESLQIHEISAVLGDEHLNDHSILHNNRLRWLKDFEAKHRIHQQKDWRRFTTTDFKGRTPEARAAFSEFKFLSEILAAFYPEREWNLSTTENHHNSKGQQQIADLLAAQPAMADLQINFRHKSLSGNMEFDLYSEKWKLAIEYQGEGHYENVR
eukprot:TRINITY_DN8925_c0_g1_i1.p1 TRINITY_DN8925_c0_g1~~TRINITY_DN8925_c0_g1_i1.p1  ORF type:complete len:571 (+),score=118.79 TRINITY_DN8925_c0_g1_i1:92-1804(+)